jgi:soluble lytic murein transglycosylase-like protein
MRREELLPILEKAAQHFRIDRNLIEAIIIVESGCDEYATRYESSESVSKYLKEVKYFAEKNRITEETEKILQRTSWGLMQVMGFLARDLGFSGNIPMLVVPEINVFYGTLFLTKLLKKYNNEELAILSYNAGSPIKNSSGGFINQGYLDKVKYELIKLRGLSH